jgi:hypothetical protein
MKELMHGIGVILRFPFFVIGFILAAAFFVPLAILSFAWGIAIIPFAFLGAAFSGNPERFTSHMRNIVVGPIDMLKEVFGGLNRWLNEGSRE